MAAYAEDPYGEYGPSDDFGGGYWEVSVVSQDWLLWPIALFLYIYVFSVFRGVIN